MKYPRINPKAKMPVYKRYFFKSYCICCVLNLRELPITETELKLIASAAIIGESSAPVIGYSNPAAIGMPKVLYAKAKNKFCLIFLITFLLSENAFRMPVKSPLTNVI